MGKDLKGRELGVGLCQRKDRRYSARVTDIATGKRVEKNFNTITEAREWIAKAQYQSVNGIVKVDDDITVDTWFDTWIDTYKTDEVKRTTISLYQNIYEWYIKPLIGKLKVSEVRTIHCKKVLNTMSDNGYKPGTIGRVKTVMYMIFDSALNNDIIIKNPVNKNVKGKKAEKEERRVLTREEQKLFLDFSRGNKYDLHFRFVLETGIRLGELRGLRWCDIDFENGLININRNITCDARVGDFVINTPKSASGKRVIPLTQKAREILAEQKKNMPKVIDIECSDCVFVSTKGRYTQGGTYNTILRNIAKKMKVEKFTMHSLRHTFATRCIEAGMRPKTLQKILGHANITMTMDLYVHDTLEERQKEMEKFEMAMNF